MAVSSDDRQSLGNGYRHMAIRMWDDIRDYSVDDLIKWATPQVWCQAMEDCMQDSQWHSEGDVWTHTKMVLCELTQLDEWPELTLEEQRILKFTTLFHDVAKPLTTKVDSETGRVTSPNHAVKGEFVTRNLLRQLHCDLPTREHICRLIRYHGRPVFLPEHPNPTFEVVRLSCLLSNRLLHLFTIADYRGRDSDCTSRSEETLHYWRMLAEELQCLEHPYRFKTDHARLTYFRHNEPNLFYVPHEEFSCTVTLMSGLPGSGKDYWLATNRPSLPIVSMDDLREEMNIEPTANQGQVAQAAIELCKEYLRNGESFAFNATNLLRQTRTRWLDLFFNYKAEIELIYIEPAFTTILQQNKSRTAAVPEKVIHRLADKSEPPTLLEAHRVTMLSQ